MLQHRKGCGEELPRVQDEEEEEQEEEEEDEAAGVELTGAAIATLIYTSCADVVFCQSMHPTARLQASKGAEGTCFISPPHLEAASCCQAFAGSLLHGRVVPGSKPNSALRSMCFACMA